MPTLFRTSLTLLLGLSFLPAAAVAQDPEAPRVRIKTDQYKRIHLQGLRPLVDGHAEDAYAALLAHDAEHPDDPETYFAMAATLAGMGELDRAMEAVATALDLGLPPARFAAGPREWFAPLRGRDDFQAAIQQAGPIVHGPMVGNVTSTGASIWVRTLESTAVTVRYRQTGSEGWQETDIVATAPVSDYTAVVRINGLQPRTTYEYEVFTSDTHVPKGDPYTFTTFPNDAAELRFIFGGGGGYVPPHERMWDEIRSREPDAMLLLGDNVYIDDPIRSAIQRFCYYRRQSRPEWRRLVSQVPVFAVWDDHDFADNDSHGGPAVDDPAWKRPVWEVFRRNYANPAYGGGSVQPGCWFSFHAAGVDVFMLDSRYYRTETNIPDRSMLGPAQLQWLLDGLAASDATFKIIATPVPLVSGTKGGSDDTWDGFPEERNVILDHIRDEEIEGVVVISADRHRSDAWRIEHPGLYPVYEFESSRLTNQHVHEEMEEAIFSYNDKQSFGQLDIDTAADDPEITYTIVSIDGDEPHTLTVKRSELEF